MGILGVAVIRQKVSFRALAECLTSGQREINLRVILVHVTIVLLVQLLSLLLGVVLGLLLVDKVQTLGLDELVDLSGSKAGEELLGKSVVHRLACLALLLLKQTHGLETGSTAEELVGERRLVRLALVDLVTGV
jgi:hypothetical protein